MPNFTIFFLLTLPTTVILKCRVSVQFIRNLFFLGQLFLVKRKEWWRSRLFSVLNNRISTYINPLWMYINDNTFNRKSNASYKKSNAYCYLTSESGCEWWITSLFLPLLTLLRLQIYPVLFISSKLQGICWSQFIYASLLVGFFLSTSIFLIVIPLEIFP